MFLILSAEYTCTYIAKAGHVMFHSCFFLTLFKVLQILCWTVECGGSVLAVFTVIFDSQEKICLCNDQC